MSSAALVFWYSLFAAIAMAANFLSQEMVVRAYTGFGAIPLSVAVGTLVGLVTKFMLDKKYIFRHTATSAKAHGKLFVLYVAMGGITTAIFWGSEFLFHLIWGTNLMRYLGGAMGLVIGYTAKYHLDKRLVFRERSAA